MAVLVTDICLELYAPVPDREIAVQTRIGAGLHGSWMAFLDGDLIGGGSDDAPLALGHGPALLGRSLEVSTILSDPRGGGHPLAVAVYLTGRPEPIVVSHAGAIGTRAAYSILVVFG